MDAVVAEERNLLPPPPPRPRVGVMSPRKGIREEFVNQEGPSYLNESICSGTAEGGKDQSFVAILILMVVRWPVFVPEFLCSYY